MKISNVSNRIKELRARHNLSQQNLADLVNCTRQTIISLEKNKYSPSYLLVCKIAKTLNVSPEEVITIKLEKAE